MMQEGVIDLNQLSVFDAGVLIILGLSGLLSFFRGFIREVFSLAAWIGATLITVYNFPRVAEWLKPQVENDMAAVGIATLGTFMVALISISIFNSIFMRFLKKSSDVGLLDNGLGLLFGLFRGALLICLAYYTMTLVMDEKDYPPYVAQAKTRPYVAKGAEWVASLAPDYLSTFDKDDPEGSLNRINEGLNLPGDANPADDDSPGDKSTGFQSIFDAEDDAAKSAR